MVKQMKMFSSKRDVLKEFAFALAFIQWAEIFRSVSAHLVNLPRKQSFRHSLFRQEFGYRIFLIIRGSSVETLAYKTTIAHFSDEIDAESHFAFIVINRNAAIIKCSTEFQLFACLAIRRIEIYMIHAMRLMHIVVVCVCPSFYMQI